MRAVWKYQIPFGGPAQVPMPFGAEVLSAQLQGSEICLWALVESDNPTQDRVFRIYGTGHLIEEARLVHIATIQAGVFVWHLFELP